MGGLCGRERRVGSRSRLRTPSILVADDDERVAGVVARILESGGLPVVTAHSFGHAQSLTAHFTVGVFDIDLGDGCGVALAEQMVEAGRVRRVVFFSGGVSGERLVRARRLGNVLLKGVDTLLLQEHVLHLAGVAAAPEGSGSIGQ